jgi:hypothetical protein
MKTAKTSSRKARRSVKHGKRRPAKRKAATPRRGTVVVPDPSAPEGPGIEVAVPSSSGKRGARSDRAATAAEAAAQVRTLDAHGRISQSPGELGPGQTHAIETGRGGRRKLVRKRFSAT